MEKGKAKTGKLAIHEPMLATAAAVIVAAALVVVLAILAMDAALPLYGQQAQGRDPDAGEKG